jgi:hypothetical protein
MQLYSISPVIEAVGLTVTNLSPSSAAQQGSPVGYSVNQSLTHGFGAGFSTLQSNSASFDPAAVTGQIVLRMSLDDATDMVTTSFSLDGGATFQSPFVTYKASFARGQGFLLGNPIIAGAKLHLTLDAETQCFAMPAIGWSRDGPVPAPFPTAGDSLVFCPSPSGAFLDDE